MVLFWFIYFMSNIKNSFVSTIITLVSVMKIMTFYKIKMQTIHTNVR